MHRARIFIPAFGKAKHAMIEKRITVNCADDFDEFDLVRRPCQRKPAMGAFERNNNFASSKRLKNFVEKMMRDI
jgi:hypothetical protein